MDEDVDQVPGISVLRAQRELLANKQPKRTVVVAVIDGGVDTAQLSLRPNLWANPKEIPGNGKDDDNNGYVDDVRGWNFIGGADGADVGHDSFLNSRACTRGARAGSAGPRGDSAAVGRDRASAWRRSTTRKSSDTHASMSNVQMASEALTRAVEILKPLVQGSLTEQRVNALHPSSFEGQQARAVYLCSWRSEGQRRLW